MLHYGFNFQWMFSWQPGKHPVPPDERALDFLAEFGFNFVRIPMDYRFFARDLGAFLPDPSIWKYVYTELESRGGRKFHLYKRILDSLARFGLAKIPTGDRFWTQDFIYFQNSLP